MQVVENNKQTRFWVFKRWGRVGAKSPQTATEECSTLQAALTAFKKVYTAKTGGNHFGDGGTFKPVEGKYTHVEIDYEEEAAPLARDGDDDGDEPMTDESSDGGSPAKAALQDGMDVDEEAKHNKEEIEDHNKSFPESPTMHADRRKADMRKTVVLPKR